MDNGELITVETGVRTSFLSQYSQDQPGVGVVGGGTFTGVTSPSDCVSQERRRGDFVSPPLTGSRVHPSLLPV